MLGAPLFTRSPARRRVRTIFSLPENRTMPLYDACIGSGIRIGSRALCEPVQYFLRNVARRGPAACLSVPSDSQPASAYASRAASAH